MKVTPAHDPHDFELGKKYNLAVTPIIDFNGRMDFSWFLAKKGVDPKYRERAEKYHRKKVAQARQLMVADLKEDGFLIKINEKYTHRIGVCYKCGTVIEPLPLPQWFVKVEPLAKKAAAVVREKKIKILPRRLEKTVLDWLVNFKDWNISRQVVWGMRIPAWQCVRCAKEEYESWIVTAGEKPKQCPKCGGIELVQDPDTFDTWFSSGQWPFATLKASHYKNDFEYFYPTSVMETAYDILPWWVCRMIMLGLYATGDTPFKTVYFHGLVRDKDGQKMSKSKGNVVNPMELIEKYGADALRISLVFGTKAGSDQSFSTDKIIGFRNFANKLWNIARFILLNTENKPIKYLPDEKANPSEAIAYCRSVLKELDQLIKKVSDHMERYQFEKAAELHYEYTWHTFADKHLETAKKWLSEESLDSPYIRGTLIVILEHILSLFHPFMPFITEEIWSKLPDRKELLIISPWPSQNKKS